MDLDNIEDECSEDEGLLDLYKQQLLKAARLAYIRHEARIIKKHMRSHGVEVISTSASQYQLCKKKRRDEEPKLDIEATGIPALRMVILMLPTTTNLRTLHSHIFETLPDVVSKIKHLQTKFDDEEVYVKLRNSIGTEIGALRARHTALEDTLVHECVVEPWDTTDLKQSITCDIELVVDADHINKQMPFQTFAKMLREDGIPLNGKAAGKNLNQEIHEPIEPDVWTWKERMLSQADDLAVQFVAPVEALLKATRNDLNASSGDPLLKQSVMNALHITMGRIENSLDTLKADLLSDIHETVFKFTTETNIYCPVASIMKPLYQYTLQRRQTLKRKPIYLPMREELYKETVESSYPLLNKFADEMINCRRNDQLPNCPLEEDLSRVLTTGPWTHPELHSGYQESSRQRIVRDG
jgi:hypothetical protein